MAFFAILVSLIMVVAAYYYVKLKPSSDLSTFAAAARGDSKPPSSGVSTRFTSPTEGKSKKPVLVLFGSQTGTAEIFAKTLCREGVKLGVPITIADTEDYDPSGLEYERMVILVCSTYGEGEPTDSMKNFHDWIMDDCRERGEELREVKYTVFGLGDRQYKYFCEEGIVMDRRLEELGAKRVYGMCCGDCGSGSLEEQFDEWRTNLWTTIGRELDIVLKAHAEEPVEPECKIKYWNEPAAPLPFPKTASVLEPTHRMPVWVELVQNDELLSQNPEGRKTRFISFSIAGTIISYQSGDHLGIVPCNTDEMVDLYLQALGAKEEENKVFSLQDKKLLKNVFPARVTIRTALKWYLDLAGPPKKSTLRAFAHCCTDPEQKEELLRLLRVNPESQKEYSTVCSKLRTVHGFLKKFDSAKVPLTLFLELMPRINPRYYSICSDLLLTPDTISATVAYTEGGLCTTMLMEAKPGEKFPIFVRKSNFHLPLRAKDRPIIMIGPGTGCAPFIGFLQRRRAWHQKNFALGPAIFFFGCRMESEDHIYKEFCEKAVADGILSAVDVAYSREGPYKVYVQNRIHERREEVWSMLQQGANLYICGDAKHMAKDVEKVLLEIAMELGKMTEEEGKAYYEKLEKEERYLKDVWSSSL